MFEPKYTSSTDPTKPEMPDKVKIIIFNKTRFDSFSCPYPPPKLSLNNDSQTTPPPAAWTRPSAHAATSTRATTPAKQTVDDRPLTVVFISSIVYRPPSKIAPADSQTTPPPAAWTPPSAPAATRPAPPRPQTLLAGSADERRGREGRVISLIRF